MSGLFRFLAWVAVIGGAVGAIIYYAYADVWVVPADDPRMLVSIEPTLRAGDILLVERHGLPVLANLVRCTDPDEPQRWIIGRLVGPSGVSLQVKGQTFSTAGSHPHGETACDQRTLVNPATGDEVELHCENEDFAGISYQSLSYGGGGNGTPEEVKMTVPAGKSYLLSDDRYLHVDSRDYGTVPENSCRHIIFRLWGADGFGDSSRRFNIIW